MNVLTCAAARGRLDAYYDGELTYGEQIDVNGHLERCEACGALLDDLRLMRVWLRSAPRTSRVSQADHDSVNAMVLSRIRAERTASWSARGRAMFEDMHFVYAGLGAGLATVACVMVMLSMTRFATTRERSPGSNQNPVVVAARLMPRPLGQMLMTVGDKGDDGAFTMSAVVTREGRVVNLELHSATGKTLGLADGLQRDDVQVVGHAFIDVGSEHQRFAPEADRAIRVELLRRSERTCCLAVIETVGQTQALIEIGLRLLHLRRDLETPGAEARPERGAGAALRGHRRELGVILPRHRAIEATNLACEDCGIE